MMDGRTTSPVPLAAAVNVNDSAASATATGALLHARRDGTSRVRCRAARLLLHACYNCIIERFFTIMLSMVTIVFVVVGIDGKLEQQLQGATAAGSTGWCMWLWSPTACFSSSSSSCCSRYHLFHFIVTILLVLLGSMALHTAHLCTPCLLCVLHTT